VKILPVIHILNEAQATSEAEVILSTQGVDGVFFINHHDDDALTVRLASQYTVSHPNHRIGMNLLTKDAGDALRIALDTNVKNLWVDNVGINTQLSPDYTLQGFLPSQLDARRGREINIFGGVAFKYQLKEPDPKGAVDLALEYQIIPTTSGDGTGIAADIEKIKTMWEASNSTLAVASGLAPENISTYSPYVEYALVATGIGWDEHHVDPEKLAAFIAASNNQ
jgi:predicted TIM-barrel enzyme